MGENSGSSGSSLVMRPLIVAMTVSLRDLGPTEEAGWVAGVEVWVSGALAASGLGPNTKCYFSRGCNPEHSLEDLSSSGYSVMVTACGT